jgi:hypothetical protein
MLCLNVPSSGTSATCIAPLLLGYTTQLITHTRLFLALYCNTFADAMRYPSRSSRDSHIILRCSLPPIPNAPVLDTIHPTTSTTFNDYVTTFDLTHLGRGSPLHATDSPTNISLYELLTQKHTTLLDISDGGGDVPKSYGSFGWVLGTDQEILRECQGHHTWLPNAILASRRVWTNLPIFVSDLYLENQPSDDLRITSYWDTFSLLKNDETFHTRDIVSSSWNAKPDHDVIMTLSALQTNSLLRLASLHVRAHQDENCDFEVLPRSDRLASE